ncbi:multiple sugar transport system ATP-binding protein [Thermoactinomyces sp. DSM 45891]|uniref:ABC transporter ATP-binding protein n=1 Tax=Thermoactinomyces sp. DSM 45891 TaxID=1761907 RepID=UPI00091E2DF7|nr:sn-glycerol-3-phosphate ABC transporter ATP-binding protein UgpC [Thermoactinomyces sp. DSM 45891]SFX22413.1 multiple sugar transport system ATP-binding protein [Thermoactinomyces sp. DSM 45891]
MAKVVLEHIYKQSSVDEPTIQDFHLEIQDKEFLVIVGPSGCGKSTILRMLAGLEEISDGTVSIDGRVMNHVEPKDRNIAMVFQSHALYPHMTVYENIAFGLKMKKIDEKEINQRVRNAVKMLELESYLDQRPKSLSGDQHQRVALGRAMVREPELFLLDEPLSNLDETLRVHMRAEIRKLHQRLGTTTIYVTHNQTEAMMGDRVVVMKDGVIQQIATPSELYHHPANLFVARFMGSPAMNVLDGFVTEEDGLLFFVTEGVRWGIPMEKANRLREKGYIGRNVTFGIRPEAFYDESESPNRSNVLVSEIEMVENTGSEMYLYLKGVGQGSMTARVKARSEYRLGSQLTLSVNMDQAYIFDIETEETVV